MQRILVINTPGLANKGGMAALIGALASLREALPQAEITVLCHHRRTDWQTLSQLCERFKAQPRPHPWLREHESKLLLMIHSGPLALWVLTQSLWARATRHTRLQRRGVFAQSDIILSLDIDTLHDHYGLFFPLWTLFNHMLGIVAGTPVIVWGAGIGHFRRSTTRTLARVVLNRVALIVAREELSKKYARSIGITRPPVIATADHAFMMDPVSPQRADAILQSENVPRGQGPLVAFVPSQLIHRYAFPDIADRNSKYQRHVQALAEIADHIVATTGARLVGIAHVTMASEDDRVILRQVAERMTHRGRLSVLAGDYLADELKAVIGKCDLMVGERMHPMIASTSLAVPTVAVIYGEKAYGILRDMMGQGEYMVEISGQTPEELTSRLKGAIDRAWDNRARIRQTLVGHAREAKERARRNGTVVRDMLEGKPPRA
jgi:colanic acid/amylovoran biosynthesis protein